MAGLPGWLDLCMSGLAQLDLAKYVVLQDRNWLRKIHKSISMPLLQCVVCSVQCAGTLCSMLIAWAVCSVCIVCSLQCAVYSM